MQMTNGEIITSYKQAKDQREQINILAQLNGTTTDTIKDILTQAGITLPQPKAQIFDARADKIISDGIANGKTAAQIADEIGGVSKQQVNSRISYLRKQGRLTPAGEPATQSANPKIPACVAEFINAKIADLQSEINAKASELAELKKILEVIKA
jgi:hypothetical protein